MFKFAKILKSDGTDGGILIGAGNLAFEEIDSREPVFIVFDGLAVPFFILDLRRKGSSRAVIHLNDVGSLKDAEELVGRWIYLEGEEQEDEVTDLSGWTLLDKGREVGVITGVEPIPGNLCIYLGDVLIPLHEDLILSCDPGSRRIDLDIPDGLL